MPYKLCYYSPVTRDQNIELMAGSKPELRDRFGVVRLALFGSKVRDGSGPGSDVDVLVGFDGPATSERYFGVQFYLEDLLDRPVDLVTEKALRPELRPFIEKEKVDVVLRGSEERSPLRTTARSPAFPAPEPLFAY
jgi:hypothetical protein